MPFPYVEAHHLLTVAFPYLKNPIAYYLLLIYLFALCKPVMPLVQDIVAHTFFEHQHMALVHQQGGSSHAKEEVGNLAGKNTNDETAAGVKSFDVVPLHIATTLLFQFAFTKPIDITHHSCHLSRLSSLSLVVQLPPPRA